ncbi:MAG TPA: quinolinate synthase [Candidatus Thermoplasmatota archaeon]|nr:quinolinate synthase [Candidatus Thermoplasmatota archaeon]
MATVLDRPAAPLPAHYVCARKWTPAEVEAEARRLESRIAQPQRWGLEMCRLIAPLTLEINHLKRERDCIILAHSYQTPDIVYGVADEVGDSYGLSKKAMAATQGTILFSSVRFMAETAKILNPGKTVLIPEPGAGCSLADGITPQQVLTLKKEHPGVPVMCYVNTTAAVKAACDVTCTSANYLAIARRLPGKELIFVPDRFMGAHLQKELAGEKTVHIHEGECEVHVQFTAESARAWRQQAASEGRKLVILAHPECDPKVLLEADYVGSTEKMMEYARKLEADGRVDIMPITECGTADRMRAEMPALNIYGACVQCPHMKKTGLASILQVLQAPRADQVVQIPEVDLAGARRTLDEMFRLTEA